MVSRSFCHYFFHNLLSVHALTVPAESVRVLFLGLGAWGLRVPHRRLRIFFLALLLHPRTRPPELRRTQPIARGVVLCAAGWFSVGAVGHDVHAARHAAHARRLPASRARAVLRLRNAAPGSHACVQCKRGNFIVIRQRLKAFTSAPPRAWGSGGCIAGLWSGEEAGSGGGSHHRSSRKKCRPISHTNKPAQEAVVWFV